MSGGNPLGIDRSGDPDSWRPAPLPLRDAEPATLRRSAGGGSVTSQRSAEELLARPLPLPTASAQGARGTSGAGAMTRLRHGLERFADATIAISTRADVPARVAALDIPAKLGASASRVVDLSGQLARGARYGLRAGGDAAGPFAAALGDRARTLSHAAGEGIGRATREVAGQVRRATHREPAAEPESQLDRLLAEDGDPPRLSASELAMPLFAGAPADIAHSATNDTPLEREVIGEGATAEPSDGAPHAAAMNAAASPPTPSPTEPRDSSALPPPPRTPGPRGSGGGRGEPPSPRPAWLSHPGTWLLSAGLLFSSGLALGRQLPSADRAATEAVVRDYLIAHPEVIGEALEAGRTRQHASAIADNRARLTTAFSGAWTGAADGDVTLVMFTDYRCGYCRASLPTVERLVREDARLKVVFRELPILSADSEAAARLALAAAKRGRYMPVHRALFTSADAEGRRRVAIAAEVPNDASALSDPAITAELRQNLDLARAIGVDGTPAWVVGDQLVSGAVPYEQLKAAIDAARRG